MAPTMRNSTLSVDHRLDLLDLGRDVVLAVFEDGLVAVPLQPLLEVGALDHPPGGGRGGHGDAREAGELDGLLTSAASGQRYGCDACRSVQQAATTEVHGEGTPSYT